MMRGDFVTLSALAKRKPKRRTGETATSSFETQAAPAPQDEGA
jgi:hypothetical protein